ncbi:hypothetical protein FQN60_007812 [Etheostoma spectabile]|uniref:Uncharacterized protein n=1 Tax=Etheostoma spectabile TaxID=54343 RepID=A0A5J5CZB5_9PERO|nr:hypothetical protein FQN60_007812 [Etheostoma spectabile]
MISWISSNPDFRGESPHLCRYSAASAPWLSNNSSSGSPRRLHCAEPVSADLNLSRALYNTSSVMDLAHVSALELPGDAEGTGPLHNGLIYYPAHLLHLGSSQRLQLSNNSLVAIHNSTFSGLDCLQELDLTPTP